MNPVKRLFRRRQPCLKLGNAVEQQRQGIRRRRSIVRIRFHLFRRYTAVCVNDDTPLYIVDKDASGSPRRRRCLLCQRSQFVEFYEEGGLFLLDEIDAADANVLLVINQALANGHLPLPNRITNPQAKRHSDFVLIAAANTFGNDANRMYVGRNQLDESTLDRFRIGQVVMDYDRELEKSILADSDLLQRLWTIRRKAADCLIASCGA